MFTVSQLEIIWNRKTKKFSQSNIKSSPQRSLIFFHLKIFGGHLKWKLRFFTKKSAVLGVENTLNIKEKIILIVGGWYCLCRKYVPSFKRIGEIVFKWQWTRTFKKVVLRKTRLKLSKAKKWKKNFFFLLTPNHRSQLLWEYIIKTFNYTIRQKKSIFSKLQTLTAPLKK